MSKYFIKEKGNIYFTEGKDNQVVSRQVAENCNDFVKDVEEEMVDEVDLSCYNCLFRRWTRDTFMCMKECKDI